MSHDPHIHIEEDHGTKESKPSVFVRVAIIVSMLVILFLIAIAIVRFVPRFISSFGQANVSLTSLFGGATATTTPASNQNNNNQNNQYPEDNNQTPVTNNNNNEYPQNNNNSNSNNQPTNNTNTGSRPTYTYTPPQTYYPTGPADLSISLVKVGKILSDGSFQQTSHFTGGDRVTMQFTVANVGRSASGAWTLSARLPTTVPSEQNYTSGAQPSIPAGASYLMTMAFDSFDPNQNSIQIVVNSVDVTTSNNTLTIPVTGTTNYTNTGNCYYSYGSYICNNNNTNYNNNYGCYWQNGYQVCSGTNYNNNSNCYYSNGSYICNNNNYNYNNNYGCYWQNGYQVCSNNSSGYPDISVSVIATGIVDRNNGQFTARGTVTRNDRAAVQIEVRNVGNTATSQWSLTATLSGGASNSSFSSGTQSMIQPGQSQIIIATFENPNPGYQTVSVQANQLNNATETNTGNNYANYSLSVSN
ncbi:MAG: hypothetical protein WC761_02785 [Candidatus Paceibacterota bacterium]|jgi:hypothetical protein